MNKTAIIRCLWGQLDGPRYDKIRKDVDRAISLDAGLDYIAYVMGKDNYDYLKSKGVKCVLVDSNPTRKYKYMWKHKLDFYAAAMSDFDEIVYLDWDCNPLRPIPNDFWDTLRKRDPIQGCLYRWKSGQPCPWRPQHYLINNGFLYFGNKNIPKEIISLYDKLPPEHKWKKNDEFVTSYYIDLITHGWQGLDYWRSHYEPDVCKHYSGTFRSKKIDPVFMHYKTVLDDGVYTVYDT